MVIRLYMMKAFFTHSAGFHFYIFEYFFRKPLIQFITGIYFKFWCNWCSFFRNCIFMLRRGIFNSGFFFSLHAINAIVKNKSSILFVFLFS